MNYDKFRGGEPVENKPMPLVSIIIPCYNYGIYLEEAVGSALNQTYKNIEVIIINDASTDPFTIKILKDLEHCQNITIIHHKKNKGLPSTRNTGVKASGGKYILPLDADDTIDPMTVEKTTHVLENNSDLGFVYTGTRFFGDINDSYIPPKYSFYTLLYHNIVSPTSLFRKEAWEQVGGYNEEFIYGYEDWEFWINLAKHGWHGFLIDEPLFNYRKHGKSMIDSTIQKHQYIVNQILRIHHDLYTPINSKNIKRIWSEPTEKRVKSKIFPFHNENSHD